MTDQIGIWTRGIWIFSKMLWLTGLPGPSDWSSKIVKVLPLYMMFDLVDQYPRFFTLAGVNRDMLWYQVYLKLLDRNVTIRLVVRLLVRNILVDRATDSWSPGLNPSLAIAVITSISPTMLHLQPLHDLIIGLCTWQFVWTLYTPCISILAYSNKKV